MCTHRQWATTTTTAAAATHEESKKKEKKLFIRMVQKFCTRSWQLMNYVHLHFSRCFHSHCEPVICFNWQHCWAYRTRVRKVGRSNIFAVYVVVVVVLRVEIQSKNQSLDGWIVSRTNDTSTKSNNRHHADNDLPHAQMYVIKWNL